MSKEKSIAELRKEIKQRFMALSEEEKNIIRENKNTPYGIVLKKILGDELLLGLRTADGKQLLNKGGRVGFSNGSSGQDYWITVQEMYDNAGGEAGTGLGLIDFANKYFPKMANGGRVRMAGGGVSQGLDYLMGIERRGYQEGTQTTPTEDFSDYINFTTSRGGQYAIDPSSILDRDTSSNILKDLYLNTQTTPTEGSVSQEGVIPGFTKLINPDGAPGNYNEFMYEGPDGQIYGAGNYSSIAAGQYPNIYDPSKNTVMGESGGIITDGGLKYRINADGSRTLLDTPTAGLYQTTNPNIIGYSPSEPAITALPQAQETAPTVAEQIISTNNLSPFSSAPLTSVAEKLFPQGDFLNIKETATSPTEYNIKATEDLVKNLPGGIVKDIVAPTAAFALSLPYDAIQAYQRMEPGSGIQGFGKAFQAERPLESAFERFTGAAGPLAENINTAISSLNPFQKQQYMNYAVQNPDQAIAAAQRNKDFLAATQKNTNPATPCSCFNGRWWKSFLFTRRTS
jgi:hypothetical protein